MPPQRVHRFRGCNVPELQKISDAAFASVFTLASWKKPTTEVLHIRMSLLSDFTVFCAFSVSVFGLQLGWFRLWLSFAFSFLFLFFWFPGGIGEGGWVAC